MRRERLYLEDILTAADAIAEFIQKQDLGSFEANRTLQSAVAHQLTIIGEAVAQLSGVLRECYPGIPWMDIKGFRPSTWASVLWASCYRDSEATSHTTPFVFSGLQPVTTD